MDAGGGMGLFGFFEEPDEEDAEETEHGGPAEDVDIGPEERLPAEHAIEKTVGFGCDVGGAGEATER